MYELHGAGALHQLRAALLMTREWCSKSDREQLARRRTPRALPRYALLHFLVPATR